MSFINPAFIRAAVLFVALFFFGSLTTFAQEGEPVVIDEVIAQAGDGVVTLSQLKREIAEQIETLIQLGKSRADAEKEVAEKKGQLIVILIDDILLVQKGKELSLSEEVEVEVNRRLLEIGRQQGINTIEELYKQMRASNVDPEAIKQRFRVGIMRDMVLSRDVDARIYFNLSDKELKDYFEKHPDKFKKQEEVKLSEIFLSFAGRSEADVKKKAEQLVAQIRGGADFASLAATNSERTDASGNRTAPKDKGYVGAFTLDQLLPLFVDAIKGVKVGGVTDPITVDEGLEILRVDERIAGSDKPTFEENRIRQEITKERAPQERKKYVENLRAESYVKIAKDYQPLVANLLATPTAPAAASTTDKKKDKEKNKKPK